MLPLYFVVLANFVFTLGICDESSWHIEAKHNPGCQEQCAKYDIWYIRAANTTSSVHSFISASEAFPTPTIMIIHSSDNDTRANISWGTSNSSSLPTVGVENVTQSYAFLLHKLIEYNDESDNVTVAWVPPDAKFAKFHYFADWTWASSPAHLDPNSSVWQFNFSATSSDPIFGGPGKVKFQVLISHDRQTNPRMPHLKFVPGLQLQFELVLDNLTTEFPSGRFATQLALVSNQSLTDAEEFRRQSQFSIDDEITPGTFEIINLKLGDPIYPKNQTSSSQSDHHIHPPAYLQTKPICYTDYEHREIKTSRDVLVAKHQDKPSQSDLAYIGKSLAHAFYGARFEPQALDVGVRLLNVSYGTTADGFYANSRFLVWTASFGLGEPPTQRLSALIIGLIVLSIVIVICSIIFGTMLILIIRARQRRHEFSLLRPTLSTENLANEHVAA